MIGWRFAYSSSLVPFFGFFFLSVVFQACRLRECGFYRGRLRRYFLIGRRLGPFVFPTRVRFVRSGFELMAVRLERFARRVGGSASFKKRMSTYLARTFQSPNSSGG